MAIPSTHSEPLRARRPARLAPLAAAGAVLLGLSACLGAKPVDPARADALRGETLGRVVDSIVVLPFERGPSVQINASDLNLFRDQFESQLAERPRLKAYPKPPTTLANTVIFAGKLLGYEVREQTAEGMFLRSVNMTVEVTVRVGADKEPALTLSRDYAYQKLYRTTEGAAALEYDLRNAAREVMGAIANVLVPLQAEPPHLEAALDTNAGVNYSHPWLVRGNRDAGFGRYESAIATWSLLIYYPVLPDMKDQYRVSDRTLARLRAAGVSEKEIETLRPLTRHAGRSLETLRDEVVDTLGPNSTLERQVLQLSDEAADRIHINLARAHQNLSQVYLASRRFDVAAYHLSRAYGYDPQAAYLEGWVQLQAQRDVIPKAVQGRLAEGAAWLQAYLRVPAPFTATVTGGPFERSLLPALAFKPSEAPVRPQPARPAAQPVLLPAPVALPTPGTKPQAAGPATQTAPAPRPRPGAQPAPARSPNAPQRRAY